MADRPDLDRYPELQAAWDRRQFLKAAAVGTTFMAVGGSLVRIASAEQSAIAKEKRADGRPRLPPGQRTLEYLRPMGGDEGDPDPRKFSLKVFGNVKTPFSVDYAGLLKLPQVEKTADVHCVTGWSMLGGLWKGVQQENQGAGGGNRRPACSCTATNNAHRLCGSSVEQI